MKGFVIDVSRCTGCYSCQVVCKDEHVGNDWAPYARPEPIAGHFWMKVNQKERGSIPKVKVAYTPVMCQHCADAPCMPVCPPQAIYRRPDGLVVIDPAKCTGCRNCIDACPYKAVYFNTSLNIAQKCTGCAHLLDQYGWQEPRCTDACAAGAIRFAEEADLGDTYKNGEILNPEFKTNPRVRYIGLPKRFVAGTVYDPVKKEVVVGATCTLTDKAGGQPLTAKTDGFGDFWFEGLKVGSFALNIEAQGFPSKSFDPISTQNDVNLGDIALS